MKAPKIFKTLHGIKYYSVSKDPSGCYRLWLSQTHPNYKHWSKAKK